MKIRSTKYTHLITYQIWHSFYDKFMEYSCRTTSDAVEWHTNYLIAECAKNIVVTKIGE